MGEFSLDDVENVLGDLAKFDFGEDLEKEAQKLGKKGPHPPVYNSKGLRELTPGWNELKLKVQQMDDTLEDFVVTEDWTVKDALKVYAAKHSLPSEFFFFQEFSPNRTPSTNWLPLEDSFKHLGVANFTKLIFRMRWFKLQVDYFKNKELVYQLYYHLKASFVLDNTPMLKRHAVRLAALQLHISHGDFTQDRFPAGSIAKTIGTCVNASVLSEGTPEKLEHKILSLFAQHKGKSPLDAMLEYIKFAQDIPTFGATMHEMTGTGHAKRRVALLDDGIAVFFGRVDDFTFLGYREITSMDLSPDDPNTMVVDYTIPGRNTTEQIKLHSPEAESVLTTACGYYHLLEKFISIPPGIPRPKDLPSSSLFICRPIRVDIFRFQTRLEYFKHTFQRQFKEAKRTVPGKILTQVNNAIEEEKVLEQLDVSSCDLDDKGMQLLATCFDLTFKLRTKGELKENLMLSALDLSNNPLRDDPNGINAIRIILACPMPIKTLLLRKIDVSKKAALLADAVKSGKHLESLNFSYNTGLGSGGFKDIFQTCSKMRLSSFSFSHSGLKAPACHDIRDFLKNSCETITQINFAMTEVESEGMAIIGEGIKLCKKLIDIDFSNCFLGPKGALKLLENVKELTTLEIMKLSDNKITDVFCEKFFKLMSGVQHPPLRILDLSLNLLSVDGVSGILKLWKSELATLEEAIFSGIILKGNFSKMIKAVMNSPKIKRLAFRSCNLHKSTMAALFELIKVGHIVKIDLSFNTIPAKLVPKLAEALAATQHLEVISLAKTDLGTKELIKIVEALPQNKTLRSFRIDGNKVSAAVLSKISEALGSVKTLRTLGLCEIETSAQDILNFLATIPENTQLKLIDLRVNKLMPVQIQEHTQRLKGVEIST